MHAKNDMNDAPHLFEPARVQVVGHLDVLMVLLAISKAKLVGVNRMSRNRKWPE